MITSLLGGLMRFIGRRTFWRINKNDEIYLKHFHKEVIRLGGDEKIAREQTELERQKIMLKRELKFFNSLS